MFSFSPNIFFPFISEQIGGKVFETNFSSPILFQKISNPDTHKKLTPEPQLFPAPTLLLQVPFRDWPCLRGWELVRNTDSQAYLKLWNWNLHFDKILKY